ncbi:MAG: peptide chain release factor N(5)-glutamine methyltransferase, partial [Bacteroidetes bacterium SW_10_40_5]
MEQLTIGNAFDQAIDRLNNIYESHEAHSIVQRLFEDFLEISQLQLYLEKSSHLSEDQQITLEAALKRLEEGEPVQYIIGFADFLGNQIYVNSNVLIPRQETEELVYNIQKAEPDFEGRILDIGTGTGCIAIALSQYFPKAEVIGIDHSKEAIHMAKTNARQNHSRSLFQQLDAWQEEEVDTLEPFDMIVSNPPYVTESEKQNMHQNVLAYEPHEALFVNNDEPLQYYQQVVHISKKLLKAQGRLYLEINEAYKDAIKEVLENSNFIDITLYKD